MVHIEKEEREQLKKQFLDESMQINGKPKHGYIGFMQPLCISDDSKASLLQARKKDENGNYPVELGFKVNNMKRGKTKDVYFSMVTPLSVGDPFIDNSKIKFRQRGTAYDPNAEFKPPGAVHHKLNTLGVEYMSDGSQNVNPKELYERHKGKQSVRGIFTTPLKLGGPGCYGKGMFLNEFPVHETDSYEGKRAELAKERSKHHALIKDKGPFTSSKKGCTTFSPDAEVYANVGPGGPPKNFAAMMKKELSPELRDRRPFVPTNPPKKGYNATINKFDAFAYGGDPVSRCQFRGGHKKKDGVAEWKENHIMDYANPTPSVALNSRNLRREFPRVFARG